MKFEKVVRPHRQWTAETEEFYYRVAALPGSLVAWQLHIHKVNSGEPAPVAHATSSSALALRMLAIVYDANPYLYRDIETPRLDRAMHLLADLDPYNRFENTWEASS